MRTDDAPPHPLQRLLIDDWLAARREAELVQRRMDAADRAERPDAWEDRSEPGLEWLGREWRGKGQE